MVNKMVISALATLMIASSAFAAPGAAPQFSNAAAAKQSIQSSLSGLKLQGTPIGKAAIANVEAAFTADKGGVEKIAATIQSLSKNKTLSADKVKSLVNAMLENFDQGFSADAAIEKGLVAVGMTRDQLSDCVQVAL